MKRRATVLLFTFIWTFLAIGGRLTYLATRQSHLTAATRQSLYTLTVDTPRGTVFDRNGQPLTNRDSMEKLAVTATPQIISQIHELFSGDEQTRLLQQISQRKPLVIATRRLLTIEGAVSFSCRDNVPYYQPAIHLVGYLDTAGTQGLGGLQKEFQDVLACLQPTTVTYSCDAVGGALPGIDPTVYQDTQIYQSGVMTTLDLTVQQAVKKAFPTAKKGAVLVQKAGSGELLACYSAPNFSPRQVEEAINDPDLPLLNRALTPYNVGSVFKLCVAAAALEAGIPPTRTYTCTGSIDRSHIFHCHKKEGHGALTMTEALAQSCNTYFIDLATAVGGDAIYRMANAMGLGKTLTVTDQIVAEGGKLPDPAELNRSPAELANFAIGQGVLMATPLHILLLTNAIANGGVYFPPFLVSGTVDREGVVTPHQATVGHRIFSADTAHALLQMMTAVMTDGTGKNGATDAVTAAGKTATAQTGILNTNNQPVNQGWFTGWVPAQSPQYIVTVLVEDSVSGGQDAAPVFGAICDALFMTAP